jgi:hypothetical protein
MKVIVTHKSPDLDALTSVWLLKRFYQGWQDATLHFVSAGNRMEGAVQKKGGAIEQIEGKEVIHVDTGLGVLDHHETNDQKVCAASRVLDFVREHSHDADFAESAKYKALQRMIGIVVENDHFQEVFRSNADALYQDFSMEGVLDGFKYQHPEKDKECIEFGMLCLDALLHTFENRIWAESEMKENGREFQTQWGKALAIETLNDEVLKLAQISGYVVVVRRDPHHGFIRIKGRPEKVGESGGVDFTQVYEKIKTLDTKGTWFLHVSKKMLLNGSSKNPDSVPTTLTLEDIIQLFDQEKE